MLLDDTLLDFSNKLDFLGLPNELQSQADMNKIMDYMQSTLLPSLQLWQFYVIDVKSAKAKFAEAWAAAEFSSDGSIPLNIGEMPRKEILDLFAALCLTKDWNIVGKRYHTKIEKPNIAVSFMAKLLGIKSKHDKPAEDVLNELGHILDDLNMGQYAAFDDDVIAILANTRNRIEYTRLADHGPKLGKITPE